MQISRTWLLVALIGGGIGACGGSSNPGPEGAPSASGVSGSSSSGGSVSTSVSGAAGAPATGSAGAVPAGGTSGSAGSRASGGAAGASGAAGAAGAAGGPAVTACGGTVTLNPNPFGCAFAWGANGNTGGRAAYLNFITTWVGSETNGGLNGSCNGCGSVRQLASTNAIPVYYAYFIGFQANLQGGFGDCNTDRDGQNLCTGGAQWIKSNRASVVSMYANYAKLTYQANPQKPVVWLLEGDFIQYTNASQSSPFTLADLGALTSEIVCAIKSNEPNAVVAINHSSWIRNPQLTNYFKAMPLSMIDLVWTTGMGNVASGYLNTGDSFNRPDGTYAYLHTLTGKNMLVDTSFGASAQDDSWTTAGVAGLNARIADGVIAANVTSPATNYQSTIASLTPMLSSICR